MGAFDGRVVIVTGAGRGIGRQHALAFAAHGASVVVNDIGDSDHDPAADVVAEIRAAGGHAVPNRDDVASWSAAERLIASAIDAFGDLDVLVNNAGFLRDRALVNLTEEDFDEVVGVHLKGHVGPARFAAAYWREQHKAGSTRPRRLINTTSTSALFANPGQSNYGAAKGGIATFSQIAAKELAKYGVLTNAVAPVARTRLTMADPGLAEVMAAGNGGFDQWDPANVSPLVLYLASEHCAFNGETFLIQGGSVTMLHGWNLGRTLYQDAKWTLDGLAGALSELRA